MRVIKRSLFKIIDIEIGAPDWDNTKSTTVVNIEGTIVNKMTPYTVPTDGFLSVDVQYGQIGGYFNLYANGVLVWSHYDGDEDRSHGACNVVPVSAGDYLTVEYTSSVRLNRAHVKFYPST